MRDGILNGEVNAMLLNSGYLSVYEDMDGYTDFSTKIKEVGTVDVESTIQSAEESTPIEPSPLLMAVRFTPSISVVLIPEVR